MLTQQSTYLARYREIRKAVSVVHSNAVVATSQAVATECARRLGVLRGQTIAFNTEDEASVLFDYCIYDGGSGDVSIIEQYCIDHPPPPGSDEELIAKSVRHARYTLYSVRDLLPGRGARAYDEFRQEEFFLTDEGLSHTGTVGQAFAGRLLHTPEYTMTTGAALPLTPEDVSFLWSRIKATFSGKQPRELLELSREERAQLSALIICAAIQRGAGDRVTYLDLEGRPTGLAAPRVSRRAGPAPRLSRNSPCYCGSGRKFKHCCGQRGPR